MCRGLLWESGNDVVSPSGQCHGNQPRMRSLPVILPPYYDNEQGSSRTCLTTPTISNIFHKVLTEFDSW